MTISLRIAVCGILLLAGSAAAQEAKPKPPEAPAKAAEESMKLPEISDEPKAVDPATLMPARLAEAATVDLTDTSLRELVEWLQTDRKIAVVLEEKALNDVAMSADEPFSDRLDNAPLYLLLNRLNSLELAWYYRDDVLHITSPEEADDGMATIPYSIGDLLDAGYDPETLETVIKNTIGPEGWDDVGGPGALSFLGDVMFVLHGDYWQAEIQGLLAALRKHGRRTYTFDPPQHAAVRQKLQEIASVDYRNLPLETAVKQLAEQAKVDIRLDLPALKDAGIRERQPVTFKLSDRKLETILQAMAADLELTWILRDGVLWITTPEEAEARLKTAVCDVRDLCRDADESEALTQALTSQTHPESWDDVGGPGAIEFARPGVMVVSTTESIHNDVMNLLENYRTALRASRPRDRNAVDPQEVITVYYRLHADVAEDLEKLLPQIVQPTTWTSELHPAGPGSIYRAASKPESVTVTAPAEGVKGQTSLAARAVLIVKQSRAAHKEIAEVIRRVENGDVAVGSGGLGGGGGGGFGGGGGGFGGGFF